jgi:hypothetical protein
LGKSFHDIQFHKVKELLAFALESPEVFAAIKEKAVEIATRKFGDHVTADVKEQIIAQLVPFKEREQWAELYHAMTRENGPSEYWNYPGNLYVMPALSESTTFEFANVLLNHSLRIVEATLSLAFLRDDHSLLPPVTRVGFTISSYNGETFIGPQLLHPTALGWEKHKDQWADRIPKTL